MLCGDSAGAGASAAAPDSPQRCSPVVCAVRCKVEACPGCLTNSRGGVWSAFSTSSATAPQKAGRGSARVFFNPARKPSTVSFREPHSR
jgi:hypothetical protein